MGFLLRTQQRIFSARVALVAGLLMPARALAQPAPPTPPAAPAPAKTPPTAPVAAEAPPAEPTKEVPPPAVVATEVPPPVEPVKPAEPVKTAEPPPVVAVEEVGEEKPLDNSPPPPPDAAEIAEERDAKAPRPKPKPKVAATTAVSTGTATVAGTDQNTVDATDSMVAPGYVPGYRRHLSLGLSPYAPRTGSMPGGLTAPPGSPTADPPGDWTFRWSGFMSASLQFSLDERPEPREGQAALNYKVPPQIIDEYWSFLSTQAMPGNWIQMNFRYGNEHVEAMAQITTYNPTRPTNFYQMGSQNFINRAYLSYKPDPIGGFRFRVNVGYFPSSYGNVGLYGNGLYTATVIGQLSGAGETISAEYDLSENLVIAAEHGFLGQRIGKVPRGVVPETVNGFVDPTRPAAWVNHAHLGFVYKGDPEYRLNFHYIDNFARDDSTEGNPTQRFPSEVHLDNTFSLDIDESYIKDATLRLVGMDFLAASSVWGRLGLALSFIDGEEAALLEGFETIAGPGTSLTENYWGQDTSGTGQLLSAGANYSVSFGTVLSHPTPFTTGPDLLVQIAGQLISPTTDNDALDGRVRHKYGTDLLYILSSWFAVGLRGDRVVPNAKDDEETFHTIAPRLQFKTDWSSREVITLKYVKWWYGERTRSQGATGLPPERLDDQLFALNFNMWW